MTERPGSSLDRTIDLLDEVLDTIVTFDGRLAYQMDKEQHKGWISFSSHKTVEQHTLYIHTETGENSKEIQIVATNKNSVTPYEIYRGEDNLKKIRYQLSTFLADWYSQVIRTLSDIQEKLEDHT